MGRVNNSSNSGGTNFVHVHDHQGLVKHMLRALGDYIHYSFRPRRSCNDYKKNNLAMEYGIPMICFNIHTIFMAFGDTRWVIIFVNGSSKRQLVYMFVLMGGDFVFLNYVFLNHLLMHEFAAHVYLLMNASHQVLCICISILSIVFTLSNSNFLITSIFDMFHSVYSIGIFWTWFLMTKWWFE